MKKKTEVKYRIIERLTALDDNKALSIVSSLYNEIKSQGTARNVIIRELNSIDKIEDKLTLLREITDTLTKYFAIPKKRRITIPGPPPLYL